MKSKTLKRNKLQPPRPVLIEGEHDAILDAWCIARLPGMKTGQHKLYLHWQLINKHGDENKPVVIRQFYNVNLLRDGSMEAGWSSNFIRDYAAVFEGYPESTKGVTPDVYRDCVVHISTRIVKQSRDSKKLIAAARYTTVDQLIALVAGSAS